LDLPFRFHLYVYVSIVDAQKLPIASGYLLFLPHLLSSSETLARRLCISLSIIGTNFE